MRYEIRIENNDTLTLGDVQGILEISLNSLNFGVTPLHLNELQLNELISAIDMIKALRPKKSELVDTTHVPGMPYYPPGVRAGVQRSGPRDQGYNETSHTDNPNG